MPGFDHTAAGRSATEGSAWLRGWCGPVISSMSNSLSGVDLDLDFAFDSALDFGFDFRL